MGQIRGRHKFPMHVSLSASLRTTFETVSPSSHSDKALTHITNGQTSAPCHPQHSPFKGLLKAMGSAVDSSEDLESFKQASSR